jgi:hypothetical protein
MTKTTATPSATPESESLPPGYDDYAGEIKVANGKPPSFMKYLPYVAVVLGLAYYVHVHATDPVNLVFAGLLLFWLIYTPIARKRGWFVIPL